MNENKALARAEIAAAIAYFEDAVRESGGIISECSPDLQAELEEQKRHFAVALEAMERLARVEAERDAAVERQKDLDDALRDMVCQYCSHDGRLDHEFMSAGEHAFDVLDLDYGAPVDMLWRGAQGEG